MDDKFLISSISALESFEATAAVCSRSEEHKILDDWNGKTYWTSRLSKHRCKIPQWVRIIEWKARSAEKERLLSPALQ